MGVIHKLTDEVVQFILEAKKEKPNISCRKLAATVSERFKIPVSKSSVNAVLKNHELSGSVGRPPGIHSKKSTFTIPTERKKQLLGDIEVYKDLKPDEEVKAPPPEPFISPITVDLPKEPLGPIIQEASSETPPTKEEISEDVGSRQMGEELPIQLMPDPMDQGVSREESVNLTPSPGLNKGSQEKDFLLIKQQFESNKSSTYILAGIAILKAAQSELSLISIFAKLLEKHTDLGAAREIQDICEAICYLRFLGIRNVQEVTSLKTDIVWELLGQDLRQATQQFWNRIQLLRMPKNFDVIFLNEMQQYGAQVRAFRIFLEDKSNLLLDVDSFSVEEWAGIRQRPLEKALGSLSSAIISNNEPVIIAQLPLSEQVDGFRNFIEAFEGIPSKRMVKIQVLDENKQKLAEFATIPQMKRIFIAGIFQPHKLFTELTRSIKWTGTESLYIPEFDDTVRYSLINTEFFVQQLDTAISLRKIILLWKEGAEQPTGAILTNNQKVSAEKTLREYFLRWPHMLSKGAGGIRDEKLIREVDNTKNVIIADFMDCFDEINLKSLAHIGRHYSISKDITYLKSMYYDLSGYLITQKYCQKTTLWSSEKWKDSNLEDLFRLLNQANIVDFQGHRLSFAQTTR